MKYPLFSAAIFIAIVSVVLFSGQQVRPFAQPQRQSAQRQTTPPKPAVRPAKPAPLATALAAEIPAFFLLPEDITFPEMPLGASRTVTLYGDPKGEGLFVTRTLIPKGAQTIPHFHPDARTVTVLSGVCYYGRGEEFDESRTIPMLPGSFFTEPAGVPHFIWAKDGDVVVQTTAIGPSGTQIVPAKKSDAAPGQP
jgi:quercetin dioxygenase-like cupin family protein